eukprot:CAMPEP_0179468096 /NCGR_PEP_ID=MMETSP0799-20121207/49102_1 /TAXON_ID=46947 /ORGANISM="Geminigera cryophila, Strain CCMP2564" /LENGTH=148 /DNA_ID=CAMNT_0021273917 /DNA_START=167 /DNA_END=610 /DNA_ORIENTATION=+
MAWNRTSWSWHAQYIIRCLFSFGYWARYILPADLSRGSGAHQEPLVVAVDRIDLSEIGGGHVGDVCYEAVVKRFTVKLLESVAEAQCSGAPVNMRLSFDSEAVWQGFCDDDEDAENVEDNQLYCAHDDQAPSETTPLQASRSSPVHEL